MPPKSSNPEKYSLDDMLDRLRDGDREKRDEESSELVTRSDGSQVMRVKKRKRRSEQPVVKKAKKKKERGKIVKFVILGVGGTSALILLVVTLLQLAKFNSESFQDGLEKDTSNAAGGTISLDRLTVTPLKARAERVQASWPETSVIQSAEFTGVEAGVGLAGFFGGNWDGTKVVARKGKMVFVGGVANQFPKSRGEWPFSHDEVLCESLSVSLGSGQKPPISFKGVELSLRREEGGGPRAILHGGAVTIRGWGEMEIGNGVLRLEEEGLWLSTMRLKPSQGGGEILVKSRDHIHPDQPSLMDLELVGVSLGHLLGEELGQILDGRVDSSSGQVQISPASFSSTSFLLPVKGGGGELRGLPFLRSLSTILSDTRFSRPHFTEVSAEIFRNGDIVRIDNLVMKGPGFMEVRGSMSVSGEGTLSGSLMVGVDAAKVERSTGERRSLVFSKKAKGGYYWVEVVLSGSMDLPEDNWESLLKKARRELEGSRRNGSQP